MKLTPDDPQLTAYALGELNATERAAVEVHDARILAGGTDLLVQMRSDIVDPGLIVDIKRITEKITQ